MLVAEVCLVILVLGFGLRFVFYDEDGPNLDRIYEKHFNGRLRKRYAAFTRTWGWLMLLLVFAYLGVLYWNGLSPLTGLLFKE